MKPIEEVTAQRIARNKREAWPPLAVHPDQHFIYADDVTRMTRREWLKVVFATVAIAAGAWALVFLLAVTPAP